MVRRARSTGYRRDSRGKFAYDGGRKRKISASSSAVPGRATAKGKGAVNKTKKPKKPLSKKQMKAKVAAAKKQVEKLKKQIKVQKNLAKHAGRSAPRHTVKISTVKPSATVTKKSAYSSSSLAAQRRKYKK